MFDRSRLQEAVARYKGDFVSKQWAHEKWKWEAVKWFQDHWDIHAEDFASMLKTSLAKTYSLLASRNHYPDRMITRFAQAAPEEVRTLFLALFDESKDVIERIQEFKLQSDMLLERYGNGEANHFQQENAISVYLWLRYPDRYYIYKYGVVKSVAEALKADCSFTKGAYADNMRSFLRFYDEICAELKNDGELISLVRSQLTDRCYEDPELKTLTTDLGFYISQYSSEEHSEEEQPDTVQEEWFPRDYDPGLSVEDWKELLSDSTIFTSSDQEIMRRFLDYGGTATCKQLSLRYGESPNFYSTNCSLLAQRIADKKGLSMVEVEPGQKRWWPILFTGRQVENEGEGVFAWRLRDELSEALKQKPLSEGNPASAKEVQKQKAQEEQTQPGYWWLNASPSFWASSVGAYGNTLSFPLVNENGHRRGIYQNFLETRAGDPIICCVSYPLHQIVALGRVSKSQDEETFSLEKVETLALPIAYASLKDCPEVKDMEFFRNPQGTLFKLTPDEYDFLLDLIRDQNPLKPDIEWEAYDRESFLSEVYMSGDRYDSLAAVLKNRKNVILQGAPGVGKTFAARRLAWSMMGEKDDSRIAFVQFHQNVSYEDFVMGFRPVGDGYQLKYGVFYRFCQKAANSPDKDFFFLIDEINRGNISRIFGELLMLIEKDYRGTSVTMAYDGQPFSVPENLYLIGMMNTADRSLSLIDYALRRRFSFFEIEPGFDSEGFLSYQKSLHNETFDELLQRIQELNKEIALDKSLGRGFRIGHSYFCGQTVCSEQWLRSVVDFDILPMLAEYWFDDQAKLSKWENILRGVFND